MLVKIILMKYICVDLYVRTYVCVCVRVCVCVFARMRTNILTSLAPINLASVGLTGAKEWCPL